MFHNQKAKPLLFASKKLELYLKTFIVTIFMSSSERLSAIESKTTNVRHWLRAYERCGYLCDNGKIQVETSLDLLERELQATYDQSTLEKPIKDKWYNEAKFCLKKIREATNSSNPNILSASSCLLDIKNCILYMC